MIFCHFPIKIPIKTETSYGGGAFQMNLSKNKNCSELLLTKGMGLDRAPVEFQKLGFLKPPNGGRNTKHLTCKEYFHKESTTFTTIPPLLCFNNEPSPNQNNQAVRQTQMQETRSIRVES